MMLLMMKTMISSLLRGYFLILPHVLYMCIYEDPWRLKASQQKPRARNSPQLMYFIQQHVHSLVCPLFSVCPFEDVVLHFIAQMHIVFISAAETTEAAPISIFARTGRNMWFKRRINRDRNKYVQRREKNQLSVGNQKWSMKLMKQQCHRLIQLSFQFPWQRNVIVPAIFSAEKRFSVKLLPI